MVKVWRESFVNGGPSTKSTKLFCFKTFYVYGYGYLATTNELKEFRQHIVTVCKLKV